MNVTLFSDLPKLKNTLYVFDIDDTTIYYNFTVDDEIKKTIEKYE